MDALKKILCFSTLWVAFTGCASKEQIEYYEELKAYEIKLDEAEIALRKNAEELHRRYDVAVRQASSVPPIVLGGELFNVASDIYYTSKEVVSAMEESSLWCKGGR